MDKLNFKDKIVTSANFLLAKQNPQDGGWGLNIEKGLQASSIVNTAEALFVINKAGININNKYNVLKYLKDSIETHPSTRGDNLRYLTFGALGLMELGIEPSDPLIIEISQSIEKRCINSEGWAEHIAYR